MNQEDIRLTDEQFRGIESIDVLSVVTKERLHELIGLASRGYYNSAVLLAIREAVYAERNGIVIPQALPKDRPL